MSFVFAAAIAWADPVGVEVEPRAEPAPLSMRPLVDPASVGIDPGALDALSKRAVESRSDALALWIDGTWVVRWPEVQEPIETMSMTKSIVDLGIGSLVGEGAIRSIDAPARRWFPGWRPGRDITLRMLLEHTSGLAAPESGEIYAAPDAVRLALAQPSIAAPGTTWAYNNSASNLVAAIGTRAAGVPLDRYVQDRILTPLGIGPRTWAHDPAGNVHGGAGLALTADDLVLVGRLMLDGGRQGDRQLVPEDWIRDSVRPNPLSPMFGRQWWVTWKTERCVIDEAVIGAWEASGVDAGFVEALRPLVGLDLGEGGMAEVTAALGGGEAGLARWEQTTWRAGRPDCTPTRRIVGYRADGWLGQQLVVIPGLRLVAVRQMRATPEHWERGDQGIDTFRDFERRVVALAPIPAGG